jgi:GH18 family chitinase
MESSMNRLKSTCLGAISAIFISGITLTAANASPHEYGDRVISNQEIQYYDGSYVKVGRKGRRNTAIALGAIVLGTMLYNQHQKQNYQRNYTNNAHVNWCYNRYRSYRAYDNTFQPYHGPRRQCISPYY